MTRAAAKGAPERRPPDDDDGGGRGNRDMLTRTSDPAILRTVTRLGHVVALAVCLLLATTDGRGEAATTATAAAVTATATSLTRVVYTRYGKMQGLIETSGAAAGPGSGANANANGHRARAAIEMFLGVPYATPPTGPNRFSPTRALTPWDGVRVFDRFGAVCPQWLPDTANETEALRRMPRGRLEQLKRLLPYLRNQSEDCLYLNIYAPAVGGDVRASSRKFPVLVYFHGESYSWNSGNPYDGRTLAGYTNSIVVTFNYRLGVLGFLNVNSEPFQKARVANYGLMDQIAALHWIQQNIGNFHGDSNNVTLMGHGTGAACVNFLMISPAVMPGLFQRTILLSGSALSSWALVEEPILYSLEIARQTNCSRGGGGGGGDEEDAKNWDRVVDCLRQVPLARLTAARVTAPTFLHAFGPSVDGVVIRADFRRQMLADVPPEPQTYAKAPSQQQQQQQQQPPPPPPLLQPTHHRNSKLRETTAIAAALDRYDLLFGCVTGEALHGFSHEDVQSGFEGERRDRILRTYIRNTYDYHLSEIFYTVVNEYTDWERTVLHPINTRDSTVAALSDARFVAPLVQTGDSFSRSVGNAVTPRPVKTFFYVFDYQTKDGDYPQRIGAVHGEDLPYIFGAPLAESSHHFWRNFTKQEMALSEALMTYVGNFARVGNPNEYQKQESTPAIGKERNRFKETTWEEYDPIHQKYMEISPKPKMKNHFRAHQLSVWLRLIPELHRAGMEDVSLRHNMFHSHESGLFEGVVRADKHAGGGGGGAGGGAFATAAVQSQASRRSSYSAASRNATVAEILHSITTLEPLLTTCINLPPMLNSATAVAATGGAGIVVRSNNNNNNNNNHHHHHHHNRNNDNDNRTFAEAAADAGDLPSAALPSPSMGRGPYTTSLAVTIAIGCTLFLLNALIYAFVRYQGEKTRPEFKGLREQPQIQQEQPNKPKQQQQQQPPPLQERSPAQRLKRGGLEFANTFESRPGSPLSFGEGVAFAPYGRRASGSTSDANKDGGAFDVSNRATTTLLQLAYDDGAPVLRNGSQHQQHQHQHHHQQHQHQQHQHQHHQHDGYQQQRRHCRPQPSLHKYAENVPAPATHHYTSKGVTCRDEGLAANRHKAPAAAAAAALEQPSVTHARCQASSSAVAAAAATTTMVAVAANNGSVCGRSSAATPPAPKCCPAAESQPLLHHGVGGSSGSGSGNGNGNGNGGHLCGSTQSLHRGAALRVPAAAISEMRV